MTVSWRDVGARIARLSIEASDGCILWVGAIDDSGYGRINFNGRNCRAQRVAWSAFHQQPFPPKALALHQCDTRSCVNPHHITVGDNASNIKEMWDRNAGRRPTHCPQGHAYSDDNMVSIQGIKRLVCRTCKNKRNAIQNAKRPSRRKVR